MTAVYCLAAFIALALVCLVVRVARRISREG